MTQARPNSSRAHWHVPLIGLAAAMLLVAGPGCAAVERACLYHPAPYPEGNWQPEGIEVEDAWFQAADGTQLHGWFVPCEAADVVILFAHGVNGNVASLGEPLANFCHRHCATVMVFDYRGYGRSQGVPSEEGFYQDARAARDWLARRTGRSTGEIVLMGRSIGGAVMVDLAAAEGARGLILESTFTSLPDVVRQHARGLPFDGLLTSKFDSLNKIGDYRGPLLISHGEADRVIDISHSERLFAAAGGPKKFIRIPAADHQAPPDEGYHAALEEFLTKFRSIGGVRRLPDVDAPALLTSTSGGRACGS